jgi:hypothetical protein
VGAFFRGYLTLTPMTLDATQLGEIPRLKKLEQAPAAAK